MLGDPMKYVCLSKELPGRSIREIVIKICELKVFLYVLVSSHKYQI